MDEDERWQRLVSLAKIASEKSYSPYSGFPVGAAILTPDGTTFSGCNIENASFGLTICAERCAILKAISEGYRDLRTIVIYTPTPEPSPPCGSCRQFFTEFSPTAEVVCVCDGDAIIRSEAVNLLPYPFGTAHVDTIPSSKSQTTTPSDRIRRICIDIDNVIAWTDEVMRRVILDVTNGRVRLNYEDVRSFNYWDCQDRDGNAISRSEWSEVHTAFSQSRYLSTVKPVTGIQDQLGQLSQYFSLHFATARLPEARQATVEWLDHYKFPRHDLHFLTHGEKHISLGRFHASVEDDPTQAQAFAESGCDRNFVIAHPWNECCENRHGLYRVRTFGEIAGHLIRALGS